MQSRLSNPTAGLFTSPILAIFAVGLVVCFLADSLRAADETIQLKQTDGPARIRMEREMTGKLLFETLEKKIQQNSFAAKTETLYDQQPVPAAPSDETKTVRHLRYYHGAKESQNIGEMKETPQLREDRRLILVETGEKAPLAYSPEGPLYREELDLLGAGDNTELLGRLLPEKAVAVNQTWTPDKADLGALFNMELTTESTVQAKLVSLTDDLAKIEMSGKVNGYCEGAELKIELQGKITFDRTVQRITWVAMRTKEMQSIGPASQGSEIVATRRILVEPQEDLPVLTKEMVASLPLESDPGHLVLEFVSHKSNFGFLHDRDWYLMFDKIDGAGFRLIREGNYIGHCNVSGMPKLPAGKKMRLDAFVEDVTKALGDKLGEVIDKAEQTADDGRVIQRVVATGMVKELPVQWTYYQITDQQGNRAVCAFLINGDLVEQFGGAAEMLVVGFQFTEPPAATAKTPEKKEEAKR